MPRRDGPVIHMEKLSVEERRAECKHFQEHWYKFIASWVPGMTVLDVGAGTGYGIDILKAAGALGVSGIDPLPMRVDIAATPIATIPSKSFDIVVSCDVIEHVEDDVAFFRDLVRVAKSYVFISTPNWNVSHAKNIYHVREYTPEELQTLLSGLRYKAITSDSANLITIVKDLADGQDNFGILIELGDA